MSHGGICVHISHLPNNWKRAHGYLVKVVPLPEAEWSDSKFHSFLPIKETTLQDL